MKKGDAIVLDINLRPSTLQEYIGQGKVKRSLQLFVDAVSKRGVVAEHLLFYGPPGMGKTTLSHIIARELNGELKTTSGPAIAKTGDLAAILTNLKDNDVLFIDEIHRLPKAVEEALYPVMEDFSLDIIIGKGPSARTMRLPIPKITIVGATTRLALLSAPLRDRFGMTLRLDYYTDEEMAQIVLRSAKLYAIPLSSEIAALIAKRARRTPRLANRILKRARDLYEVKKLKEITPQVVDDLFSILEIDEIGLTDGDRKYLLAIIEKFDGGPVGVSTLAHTLSEDIQTIEEYIEPYLMRIGFLKKTGKGRVVTPKAYSHLNLASKKQPMEQTRLA